MSALRRFARLPALNQLQLVAGLEARSLTSVSTRTYAAQPQPELEDDGGRVYAAAAVTG
jgi:hypothetical protein